MSATPKTRQKKTAKPRPTQSERRDGTRRKILEATLYCLAKHGYAATGVSQIVARARVSRGAWSHHFPSMDALMLAAAEHLMAQVYERLLAVLQELKGGRSSLDGFVQTIWKEFFASEVNEIYLELLVASRRDAKLAATLSSLSVALERNLRTTTEQFFESRPGAVEAAAHMMILSRWVMRGIALDAHLLPDGAIGAALDAWGKLLATQMRARSGKTR